MQDRQWKYLANDAAKLYMGTEKEGIGKFLYRLRQEVPYAQLSSHLASIFYHSEVWEWNEQKRGMKFLLLPGSWQEKTTRYYRNSTQNYRNSPDPEIKGIFIDEFSESGAKLGQWQEQDELQKSLQEGLQKEPVQKIEQTKLSAFFGF